jgi:hypothetical protein
VEAIESCSCCGWVSRPTLASAWSHTAKATPERQQFSRQRNISSSAHSSKVARASRPCYTMAETAMLRFTTIRPPFPFRWISQSRASPSRGQRPGLRQPVDSCVRRNDGGKSRHILGLAEARLLRGDNDRRGRRSHKRRSTSRNGADRPLPVAPAPFRLPCPLPSPLRKQGSSPRAVAKQRTPQAPVRLGRLGPTNEKRSSRHLLQAPWIPVCAE